MNKNYTAITLTAAVALVVIIVVYFFSLKESTLTPATPNTVTVIESQQDLDKADNELSSDSEFDDVEASLNQLDAELSSLMTEF